MGWSEEYYSAAIPAAPGPFDYDFDAQMKGSAIDRIGGAAINGSAPMLGAYGIDGVACRLFLAMAAPAIA
jgi:hypothetical protein